MEIFESLEKSILVQILVGLALLYGFHFILKKLIQPKWYIFGGTALFFAVLAAIGVIPNSTISSLIALALAASAVGLVIQGFRNRTK
jgi:hypothetical protein